MLLVQLGARLSPLGGAEYVGDLSFAGEVVDRRRHLGSVGEVVLVHSIPPEASPPASNRRSESLAAVVSAG